MQFMALLATITQVGQLIINTDDNHSTHQFEECQKSIPGRLKQQNLTVVVDWKDVDRRNKLINTCQANSKYHNCRPIRQTKTKIT